MKEVRNPFLTRGNPKDQGAHGRSAEKHFAKRIGGQQQPGSGALDGAKGDVVKDGAVNFIFENKSTKDKSFSLKRDYLLKVYQEALEQNRYPALSFQFVNDTGQSEKRERWIAVPEHVFAQLIDPD